MIAYNATAMMMMRLTDVTCTMRNPSKETAANNKTV
jgi:hypothetical protein